MTPYSTKLKLHNLPTMVAALFLSGATTPMAYAFTASQQPPESTAVPGNVLLALSVEFPTGLQVSYSDTTYTVATRYEGYFHNEKCYSYSTGLELFQPVTKQNANGSCPGATEWSGNLLNWLTMTNVDQFRSVMTGGTRDNFSSMAGANSGDTTGRTVLIRSLSDRDSYNPIKTLTVGTVGMPLTGVNKSVRSGGYGSKFIASNANNFAALSTAQQRATCAATPLPGNAGTSWCYNIRVEACVTVPVGQAIPDVGLEANCKNKYSTLLGIPSVPKPEGLIQEYANTLRFGAVGYLNETGQSRNGGVLRSAMKSVGAVAATKTGVVANTLAEWNATTGVMIDNPDPADSAASAVAGSGLMNYLNKFGFEAGYKGNDPVSELYYAAQLYFRGITPPANYSSSLTAALKDGFPVITGNSLTAGQARDPILNSCSKNFILGIGDIYTHCDGNLPGSTKNNSSTCGTSIPVDPDNLNVQGLWDTTRGLEGLADNGWVGGATAATPYIAGLAHWANTNDIRPDLTGKQTISTYWVDVLENNANNVYNASRWKSQYWLAAKYGGFDTTKVTGNNPNTVQASWDNNNDGIPDTWFAGSNPVSLKAGLTAAFSDIASRSGANSASGAAVTSNRQTTTSQILYAGYNPKGWLGTVRACSPTQTAAQCTNSPAWEASNWFKTTIPTLVPIPLTPATRKIFTSWKGSTFASAPFQWGSLNTAQVAALNSTDSQGSARLAYLRGDRTNEGGLFRKREDLLLGDIVNSGVTYLSGAGPAYLGANFPGHAAYRASNKTRPPVVYVGANDGMLHAFSGSDGKELFGYIPGSVFANLPSLTATAFQHRFFVDSTPMVGDIQKNATTWGTILVGGLGAGGKGYYALDIAGQSTFATDSEATLSALPIWEFTSSQDADLGLTFNSPSLHATTGAYRQIAKVADSTSASGVWRVVVGNGYGSTVGKAALFLVDANTGVPASKMVANAGPNNGLSTPTPVDTDYDGLIDTIYAGDALGNMHKFQFSTLSGSDFVLAKPGAAGGGSWNYLGIVYASGQPITTAPSVALACDGNGWNVAFGTGKLNEDPDYTDTATRGFYAIVDKNPSSSLTVSSSDIVSIPFTASTVSTYTVRNWTTPNLAGKRGWKMDFTGGERVLSNSTIPPDTGNVLFGTTKPTGDVCTPGNTGFVMAVNLCTGKIGNMIVGGQFLAGGIGINSTGVVMISNTNPDLKNKQKVVCNQDDCKGPGGPSFASTLAPRGRYSWREILTK